MPTLKLNIKRFDLSKNPHVERATIECEPSITYNDLKEKVMEACKLSGSTYKVIKLRNSEQMIIPYSMMFENVEENYFVDVTNINQTLDNGMNLLQDAYANSVHSKVNNMESRIQQAENLLPQLECRRHAHVEETVGRLTDKVTFLNRRFDDLVPEQLRSKMPHAMAGEDGKT